MQQIPLLEIHVKFVDRYRDGGTEEYVDSTGQRYFIDKRIDSTTKGKVYNKYPTDEGARQLPYVKLFVEAK